MGRGIQKQGLLGLRRGVPAFSMSPLNNSPVSLDSIAASSRMKKCNVAMIGYGWASSAHIPAINATSLAQENRPVALAELHG